MSVPRHLLPVALAGLLAMAAACGSDEPSGAPADGTERTVEVKMVDIAYEPTSVDVEAGETVRFVFTNEGAVAHDAFIGDEAAQADHESEMRDMDDMGDDMEDMDHSDGDGITVQPGETGELTYTFSDAGPLLIGCHEPDHYDAGMVIEVSVT